MIAWIFQQLVQEEKKRRFLLMLDRKDVQMFQMISK